MKSSAFNSPEGWRVQLELAGYRLESPAYENKLCADAAAEQTDDIFKRAEYVGYESTEDFLTKLESWFGWSGNMAEGNTEEIALKLKVKEENIIVANMKKVAQAFVVYDQAGLDLIEKVLLDVKARYNWIEAERKKTTSPMYSRWQKFNALFKEPLAAYSEVEEILKSKVLDAQLRAKQAQDAALQAAQVAHQAGDRVAVAVATHQVYQADISHSPGISTRETYGFEIVDHSLLPRQFLMANEAAIRAHVKAYGMQANIPGVRVFDSGIVSVRP